MQLMNQVQREIIDSDRDIRSLKERKTYLEGELASLKPHTPIISAGGERLLDTSERLKALRAQYASASAFLEPDHPDLIKVKQELSALEKEAGATDGREELSKRLTAERASLAALRERMEASHPDIVRAQAVVASLERELAAAMARPLKPSSLKPENPAYINIQSQLASTSASLRSLETARLDLNRRMAEYAKRLETTPTVEPEYLDLVRDRENSVRRHHEITARLMEAQVSGELEVQRKGERFSLIRRNCRRDRTDPIAWRFCYWEHFSPWLEGWEQVWWRTMWIGRFIRLNSLPVPWAASRWASFPICPRSMKSRSSAVAAPQLASQDSVS
jgi:polysaccharide biosynthesis transport protein